MSTTRTTTGANDVKISRPRTGDAAAESCSQSHIVKIRAVTVQCTLTTHCIVVWDTDWKHAQLRQSEPQLHLP
jgi:hypothetical protein